MDVKPRVRARWALWGFLAVAAFFLWSEHRAHVMGLLPYLLLFACPIMHLFHHHGHGQNRHRDHGHGHALRREGRTDHGT